MHTSELFRLDVSAGKFVDPSILIDVKPTSTTHNNTKPQVGDIPFGAVLLAPICFMIVWAIVVFTVSKACKVAQKKDEIVAIDHLQQHPCRNCRFFNDNHFLKCAVRPSTALTKQALNCSDYWSE